MTSSAIRLASVAFLGAALVACGGRPSSNDQPGAQALADHSSGVASPAPAADAAPAPASGRPTASASADRSPSPAAGPGDASGLAAAPVAPAFREIVVPAGTVLRIRLTSDLASDSSAVEDAVRATLDAPVVVDGDRAIPAGATVRGSVRSVQRSGKVTGRASLAFGFERLSVGDEDYDLRTERISRLAPATKRSDATKIGIGAGAGALIGAVAGGGKGAAIGSAVGAGAGGGVVVATRGAEVRLPSGTALTTKLTEPLTVRVAAQ